MLCNLPYCPDTPAIYPSNFRIHLPIIKRKMSARTCLLCGKPLSRIWVGAGDDFCSREHGNQYRLKRGMDRLTEANKISSLMRRRETPRPITPASLPLDSASSRRDFPGMKIPASGE